MSMTSLVDTAGSLVTAGSGLFAIDETIRQATGDGIPFVQVLQDINIVPGITFDRRSSRSPRGLRRMGTRFAKWRVMFKHGPAGSDCRAEDDIGTVASATPTCMMRCVPAAMAGIAFLSAVSQPNSPPHA